MKTIAEAWMDEGMAKGILKGKKEGITQGREAGIIEGKEAGIIEGKEAGIVEGEARIVRLMINNGMEKQDVARVTGFTIKHIDYLLSLDQGSK